MSYPRLKRIVAMIAAICMASAPLLWAVDCDVDYDYNEICPTQLAMCDQCIEIECLLNPTQTICIEDGSLALKLGMTRLLWAQLTTGYDSSECECCEMCGAQTFFNSTNLSVDTCSITEVCDGGFE